MVEASPGAQPELSVVVVVYNMRREAPRTLKSLASAYQRDTDPREFEVVVVENGSTEPLDAESVRCIGDNFRYFFIEDASPSPAAAVNFGVAQSQAEYVGVLIDGARIVTPGMLSSALSCLRGFPRAVVGSLGFHLGPDAQNRSQLDGYNQHVEDQLLAEIGWSRDGYRLFEIGVPAGSSKWGWFQPITESNCLFMPKALFDELGGFDEAFDLPGGGMVNLDFWARACQLPSSTLIMLLGEASFHQFHNGAATGLTEEKLASRLREWGAQYAEIRGHAFVDPDRRPMVFGDVRDAVLPWIGKSCELAALTEPR